jgi:hypothetical protein
MTGVRRKRVLRKQDQMLEDAQRLILFGQALILAVNKKLSNAI